LVLTFRREMRVRAIRVVGTGRRPEMSLADDQKYHLFLSHVWSTGQDAVATIKRQLQLLLRDVSVFLDVDDLQSIDDLELYVEQSDTMLLFLSKGYFVSRNCIREVVATLEQAKKYVFAHEADPDKGGATVEELKKELKNKDHRDQLFDEAHRINVWHRIQAFQEVTLAHIVEDMLRQCVGFDDAVSLYIPDSSSAQRLVFRTPVVLYVSRHNRGAAQVAHELCSSFEDFSVAGAIPAVRANPEHRGVHRSLTRGALAATPGAAATARLAARARRGIGSRLGVVLRRQARSNQTQAIGAANTAARPTHFLLYLNDHTFIDDEGALATEVRAAMAAGVTVAMIHEKDEARGGCDFGNFFQSTPQDLIDDKLYSTLAIAFVPGDAHRAVSRKLFARSVGAEVAEQQGASMRSFLLAGRSTRDGSYRRRGDGSSTDAPGQEVTVSSI